LPLAAIAGWPYTRVAMLHYSSRGTRSYRENHKGVSLSDCSCWSHSCAALVHRND